jgi:tetratricopeptide (TPR) repeat protein
MKIWARYTLAILCLGILCGPAQAAGAPKAAGVTMLGVDPSLAAGADALRLRQFDEGIRLTLLGLSSVPSGRNRARGLNNLCAGYVGARQYQKAVEACDSALALNKHNWRIYNNRALAMLGLGRVDQARRNHADGLALKPDSRKLAATQARIETSAQKAVIADASPLLSSAADAQRQSSR